MQSRGIIMKNEVKMVELTKDLFFEVSTDKTTQIAQLKQDRDDTILKIQGRIQTLKELRAGLKQIKKNIRLEKKALSRERLHKFALKRDISIQNRFARDLNKAYIAGIEQVDLRKFYTKEEQKIR